MTRIRRFILLLAIAFSLGGFTFYAGVVVPIGSSVFDSTAQGFVTRRVTNVFNLASGVTWLLLLWEAFATRHRTKRGGNWLRFSMLAIYLGCLMGLLVLHPKMDALLDESQFLVLDAKRFYNLHRVYLWTSTIQWLASLALVWCMCTANSDHAKPN